MSTHSDIDTDTLRAWLATGTPVTILDVRPSEEHKEWFIPGSIHVDAYTRLQAGDDTALADLELPSDRPVVTICAAGRTSAIAARHLQARGFDARSLGGGMRAWSLAWNTAELSLPTGIRILQVRRTGKGCLSYLVMSKKEALLIDPALPAEVYENLAREHRVTIIGIMDTHVHADHLSRSKLLAETLNVPWYLPNQERVTCSFIPLKNNDSLPFGNTHLQVMHTPGHTWESSSYLIEGAVFTGDTLFTEGVGRPDLEATPEEAKARAEALHASLQKLFTLPKDSLVMPGHTSQPLDFSGTPWTATLNDVKANVKLLALERRDFIKQLITNVPDAPPNHAAIVQFNEACETPGDVIAFEAGANRCAVR